MDLDSSDGGLHTEWRRFLTAHDVTVESLLLHLGPVVTHHPRVSDLLTTYIDEGPTSIDLVASHLTRKSRILEVGSGIGLVSRFLAEIGHDVVSTEPAPEGFALMNELSAAIDAVCGPVVGPGSLKRLDLSVDDLDPATLGRFDVVFSANVLEHVPDPSRALLHLQNFVAEGGLQAHVCPNYALPYDPHIGRLLLPIVPSVTRWILSPTVRDAPEFSSVNFVTAGVVGRAARAAGLEVEFDTGLLAAALDRFDRDRMFTARHAGLGPAVRIIRRLGLGRLLSHVPPGLASPMRFTVRSSRSA